MLYLLFALISEKKVIVNPKYLECERCKGNAIGQSFSNTIRFYKDGFKFFFSGKNLHPEIVCKVDQLNVTNSYFVKATSFSSYVPDSLGGAIYSEKVSKVIIQHTIFHNDASNIGGAIAIVQSPSILINSSSFIRCQASHYGGAGFISASGVVINESHFEDNFAKEFAALLLTELTGRTSMISQITHCEFIGNQASYSGSAVAVTYSDYVYFSHLLFSKNKIDVPSNMKDHSNLRKGSLYIFGAPGSRYDFDYITFQENAGVFDGFAIYLDSTSNHPASGSASSEVKDYEVTFDATVITQKLLLDGWEQECAAIYKAPTVNILNYSSTEIVVNEAVLVTPFGYTSWLMKLDCVDDPLILTETDDGNAKKQLNHKLLDEPEAGVEWVEPEDQLSVNADKIKQNIFTQVSEEEKSNYHVFSPPSNSKIDTYSIAAKTIADKSIDNINSHDDADISKLLKYRSEGFCSITIERTQFNSITSRFDGSIAFLSHSNLIVSQSTFTNCKVDISDETIVTKGGVFYLYLSSLTITNSVFNRPQAKEAYAIYLERTSFLITGCTFTAFNDDVKAEALEIIAPYPYTAQQNSTISGCRFVKGINSIGINLKGNDHQYAHVVLSHSCFDSRPFSSSYTSLDYLTSSTNPDISLIDANLIITSGTVDGKTVYGGSNKHSYIYSRIQNANVEGTEFFTSDTNTYCNLEYISIPVSDFTVEDKALVSNIEESKEAQKETPWMFIIIGGVAFVIIVLLVIIIIVKKRAAQEEYDYDNEEEEEETEMMAATTVTIGSVSELPVVSLNNPLCTVQQQSSDDSLFDDVDDLDFA